MTKVAHLGKFYPPVRGGMETVLATLCRGDEAIEHQVLVTGTSWRTCHETIASVPVTRAGTLGRVGSVSVTPALPRHLARVNADVLVLHEPNPMALVAYALARPALPLVVWFHAEVVRSAWRYRWCYRPWLEFALRRAVRIVVASPPLRDAAALAPFREKVTVVPYGVHPDRYRLTPDLAARVRRRRGSADPPTFLFVGRLVPYKGVDVLLRALRDVAGRAVIVGDGPQRAWLEAMAAACGVVDRVVFLGHVSDDERLAWLHACDALVLPSVSRQEAFGMVQLEAMACQRPVVSTDLGTGVAWVNRHERTGLVVPPGDPAALAGALARLASDPALWVRLGERGRARVEHAFSAVRMRAQMAEVYRAARVTAASQPGRTFGAAHDAIGGLR